MMRTQNHERNYRRAAIEGASSVALVIMLYDRLVMDLQRAISAIRSRDIETRSTELKHALLILQQLEGTLDHENGGPAARSLQTLYSYARARILQAQFNSDPELLIEVVTHVLDVKSAWQRVERMQNQLPAGPDQPASAERENAQLSFTA